MANGQEDPLGFLDPGQIQGIGTQLIPGYYPGNIPALNFPALHDLFLTGNIPGGGGPVGGGGVGAGPGSGSAGQFLESLYNNPNAFGNLDPNFVGNIDKLSQQMQANYPQFQGLLTGLGQQTGQTVQETGNTLMEFIMGLQNQIGVPGGGGGGGGFSVGFSPGQYDRTSIQSILDQIPEFQGREIRTDLPTLDPELAAQMQTLKENQLREFEAFRRDQNAQLLGDLFGRGIERSTVAGEAADRAARSLERTRGDIVSRDISRRLGLREDEAQRILAADTSALQAERQAYGDRLRSMTGIKVADINAAARAAAAASSAGASVAGSRLAAQARTTGDVIRGLASIYGSQSGSLTDIFGSQAAGLTQGFGTQQGALTNFAGLYGDLATNQAQNEIARMLGIGEIAAGERASERQARVAAGRASMANRQQALNNFLNLLSFQEQVAGRQQQGLFNLADMGFRRELFGDELAGQLQLQEAQEPSDIEVALAILGTLSSSYGNIMGARE